MDVRRDFDTGIGNRRKKQKANKLLYWNERPEKARDAGRAVWNVQKPSSLSQAQPRKGRKHVTKAGRQPLSGIKIRTKKR